MTVKSTEELLNYVGGSWRKASGERLDVRNPATAEVIARVPLSPREEVGQAVAAGVRAFAEWRHTPVVDRIQPLFRLKTLLEEHLDELAAHHHQRMRQDASPSPSARCGAASRTSRSPAARRS